MAEPTRIAFLSTGLATGGAEMMLLKLLGALPRDRFECRVLSLRDAGTIGPRIASLGVPVTAVELHRPLRLPGGIARAARQLRAWRPALLVGWMYHGNVVAALASRLVPGARVIWSIRQTLESLGVERPMTQRVIRLGARWSDRVALVIYNSGAAATQHRALGYRPRREVVIPNGFDCEQFRPRDEAGPALRRRLGIGAGVPVVGLLARYHPMKDHATFLAMAARLVASGSEAHFICAGHGADPGNAVLAGAVAASGLADRVHLLGEVTDMPGLVAGLTLLCSSSARGEGFPNVIGEAMASGVPCVVTDVGDSAMVVGATGVVVAPGDAAGLAAGCARLMAEAPADRARRGAAARARVVEGFSLGAVTERYAQAFADVLAGPRGPD